MRSRHKNGTRPPTNVNRRLNLDTPVGRHYFSGSRFYSNANDDIIVPESPVRNAGDVDVWGPGQTIPIHSPINTPTTFEPCIVQHEKDFDLQSMFQSMQHTIESKFEEVKEKLLILESRVSDVEKKAFRGTDPTLSR